MTTKARKAALVCAVVMTGCVANTSAPEDGVRKGGLCPEGLDASVRTEPQLYQDGITVQGIMDPSNGYQITGEIWSDDQGVAVECIALEGPERFDDWLTQHSAGEAHPFALGVRKNGGSEGGGSGGSTGSGSSGSNGSRGRRWKCEPIAGGYMRCRPWLK